ncbi:MAG: hypothetical protein KGL35_24425, partial [Bradyrhizobium sp.]|nr:hypothetical protein [Bradyrhizobium sp.]
SRESQGNHQQRSAGRIMCAEKVNAPTVDEVRELLREYSGERPEPPKCPDCGVSMVVDCCDTGGWYFERGCDCQGPGAMLSFVIRDERVVNLCNHFLDSQQPMTAGEFAGLVIASIERERNDRQQEVMKLPADSLGCNYAAGASNALWLLNRSVHRIAREHNITIVEPKK